MSNMWTVQETKARLEQWLVVFHVNVQCDCLTVQSCRRRRDCCCGVRGRLLRIKMSTSPTSTIGNVSPRLYDVVNSRCTVTLHVCRDDGEGRPTIVVPEKNGPLQERKCAELPPEVTGWRHPACASPLPTDLVTSVWPSPSLPARVRWPQHDLSVLALILFERFSFAWKAWRPVMAGHDVRGLIISCVPASMRSHQVAAPCLACGEFTMFLEICT